MEYIFILTIVLSSHKTDLKIIEKKKKCWTKQNNEIPKQWDANTHTLHVSRHLGFVLLGIHTFILHENITYYILSYMLTTVDYMKQ